MTVSPPQVAKTGQQGTLNNPRTLATTLWQEIAQGKILPRIAKYVGGVDVPPLIVGDLAFPFQTWLMKPYTNAVLTEKQKYFKDGE